MRCKGEASHERASQKRGEVSAGNDRDRFGRQDEPLLHPEPDGEVVEEGSFRNQVSSSEAHFGGEPRRIALKAGAQSAWISRELKRLGHEVIVHNACELKRQQDRFGGCAKLALLARADVRLLAPVEHRKAEQQAELAVIRASDAMMRARMLLINSARGSARDSVCAYPSRSRLLLDNELWRICRRGCEPGSAGCSIRSTARISRSASWLASSEVERLTRRGQADRAGDFCIDARPARALCA